MTTASRMSGPSLKTLREQARHCRACHLWKNATQTVKHFKFVQRGKIRLHQKPNTAEIKACRQWYERELALIKPALVVAMGATAAQSVFGKITPINKKRGRPVDLDDGIKALVTVHPSYLLRLPDAESRTREYARFVDDFRIAAAALRKAARAA